METDVIPTDLPTASPDYEVFAGAEASQESQELTELENRAHAQKVLLSSDAMRLFVSKVGSIEDRFAALDMLLSKARVSFPSEDGWVVINLVRMEELLEELNAEKDELVADESAALEKNPQPMTSGSLAEAIITGNVGAAYELMAERPMIALADASADLDALYRFKRGEDAVISELLKEQAALLEVSQIEEAIAALTSALDGTYTDEASAVKMAALKAVKALAR